MKENNNMYISMHALQNIPPSCLNRDEENRPKTCIYGQTERMRISSQCFKAAMRKYFSEHIDEKYLGLRTKYLPQQLAKEIEHQNPGMSPDEAMSLSLYCISKLGLKTAEVEEEGDMVTKLTTLTFVSRAQIRRIASIILQYGMDVLSWDSSTSEAKELKKSLVQAIQNGNSIDLALFGRMVADSKGMNIEGSMNVAHIIGVSELARQEDFYTAVDECNPRDDNGAGMMGDIRFVSDVVYRFACINSDELAENLSEQVEVLRLAISEAMRAFVCAEPSARQHSMATHVLPEYVRIEVRSEPLSYVSAFESPLECSEGLMPNAVHALEEKAERFARAYSSPEYTFVLNLSEYEAISSDARECESIDEMIECVLDAAAAQTSSEEQGQN